MRWTYQSRANRDEHWRRLRRSGVPAHQLIRSSMRNQLLHPQYVEDYPDAAARADSGFGNTVYKTWFGRLYMLEQRSW